MRLAWPELAIVWIAVLLGLAILCFGAVLNGASTSYEWVEAGASIWMHLIKIIVLPFWLTFRVLDWLSGGPERRRRFTGRLLTPGAR